jgi:hypothetical protein
MRRDSADRVSVDRVHQPRFEGKTNMRHARSGLVTIFAALVVVAGCSGGGGATIAPGATAPSQPAASGVQAPSGSSATAAATGAAATAAAASTQPAAGGGALPADPCTLVTAADVQAVYGGKVNPVASDGTRACAYEIEGKAKAGQSAAAGEFAVSFGDEFSPYETAKMLFGDGVTKVEGLGTEAYSVGGFIHAKVGDGDLVVGGVWVGDYDRALLASEDVEMARLLLGRL